MHKFDVAERQKGRRVRTKTYSIGLFLVGGVILIQLAALVSIFLLRRAVQIDSEAPQMLAPVRLRETLGSSAESAPPVLANHTPTTSLPVTPVPSTMPVAPAAPPVAPVSPPADNGRVAVEQ